MAQREAAGTSRASRQRRWWRLRQRWRMLGVFEINPEHEFYHLTSMIKEGIHASIQTTMNTPGQGFEMQTFAAPVFAKLRRSMDITEEEYMNSLCSGGCYLQFVSNSKSKADFFVTNDKRFFLKTQSRREVRFLLSNLQAYMEHLEKYPHSLLKYFIVMQSVFYPDERINIRYSIYVFPQCVWLSHIFVYVCMKAVTFLLYRYDIKGCEVGRWTNPTLTQHIIKVLKDNNFEGQHIALGEEKCWFVNQMKMDAAFLQELNVLDYSLLLAHQPLHQDELDGKHSLANLVIRATKSVDLQDSPTASDPPNVPLLEEAADQVVLDTTDCGSGQPQGAAEATGEGIPLQEKNCPPKETQTDSELQEFHEHHCRLLPNCKNSIHVIDGPDRRYFVGIIDIFTVYGSKKRLENLWKNIRFPGRAFSTVSPPKYSRRFCQWIQEHTR
ncbi:hypothetical protein PAMP_014865 [Pampus punctatissimus]